MAALASFVTGRRTKWVVIGLWIVAVVALVAARRQARRRHPRRDRELPARRGGVDQGPGAAQGPLPRRRDQHRADRLPARGRADGGRQGEDRPRRQGRRRGDPGHAAGAGAVRARRAAGPRLARRGDAAYTVVTVPLDFDKVADWGKETRDVVGRRRRRARGLRHRRPRPVRRLRGGLRRARHQAAAGDGPARADPARRDLPRAADRGHPDRRRRALVPGRDRASSTCTPTPATRSTRTRRASSSC